MTQKIIDSFRPLVSRLLFALALLVPTLDALAQPAIHMEYSICFWFLLITLIPAMAPKKTFFSLLAITWILSPLIIGLMAYICLDGTMPYIENVRQTIEETNPGEVFSTFRLAVAGHNFISWVAGYFISLLSATFLAWHNSQDPKIAKPLLAFSLFCLGIGFCLSQSPNEPAFLWFPKLADLRMTVIGQLGSLIFNEALYHGMATRKIAEHGEAHETIHITQPFLSILVIGESMRADGLGPETAKRGIWSKELDERTHKNLAAWLPPACAAHDSTVISVPALITGTPPEKLLAVSDKFLNGLLGSETNGDDIATLSSQAQTAPTGLSRLQSAGYDVGWIASGAQGRYAGPEVDAGRGLWFSTQEPFDESLLPVAANFIRPMTQDTYNDRPKALIIHLFGSHFLYQDRYPVTLFGSEPTGLSEEQLQDLRYNRANEYGAKNLTAIAQMIDMVKVPAIAIYTSDHGDNLIRDHNGLLGHVAVRTSLAADLVPVFVMWNEAANKSLDPQQILTEVQKVPRLAQVDIYHLWMSFSGLENKNVRPTSEPMVFGAVHVGDKFTAIPCAALQP